MASVTLKIEKQMRTDEALAGVTKMICESTYRWPQKRNQSLAAVELFHLNSTKVRNYNNI